MVIFLLFWLSFDCFWRLVHCWYSLDRPVTIGTPMVIYLLFDCLLTVFDGWYIVGTVLVDMWRLVQQWSFWLFWLFLTVFTVFDDWYTNGHLSAVWLSFDCFWRLVHCWYSIGRPVTIGTAMVILAVLTVFTVFDDWYTNGHISAVWLSFDCFWRLVHCWYSIGRHVTIGTPMVIYLLFDCLLTVFDGWYTVGTVLVDLWRLVHQWSFICCLTVFWLFLTVGTLLVQYW